MESTPLNLFYSYSHKDKEERSELEKHLTMLVRNKIINPWHDGQVTAGSLWETEIFDNLEKAEIVIFLITANWLNSQACVDEWDASCKIKSKQPNKRLIPIIATECAWKDFDNMSSLLGLPTDGTPVSLWENKDKAWHNVYEGIKGAATELKKNFIIKPDFKIELEKIEFCSNSQYKININDIFVFPNLYRYENRKSSIEEKISNHESLLENKYQFIHGDSQSGKTKLGAWLHLKLCKEKKPCIYIDFNQISNSKKYNNTLKNEFERQTSGSFELWKNQSNKTIILDNLTEERKCTDLLIHVQECFEKIIIFTSSDTYSSYYVDDERFIDYKEIQIKPFCHIKQEQLISNWVKFKSKSDDIDHNLIDSLENNINSIIIDNKVLPRYPFFILSILQTYEGFMPENLKITAYGHCYHALILARLIKTGINQEDSALGSAFTFCSNLSYQIFKNGNNSSIDENQYKEFCENYTKEYIIKESVLNRLFGEHGLLENKNGKITFCISYSYYYFLGKHLTENYTSHKSEISSMIESSFARHNSLTLIFTIHHANDISIIDEILTHTLCAIDDKHAASLDKNETVIFNDNLNCLLPEKFDKIGDIVHERSKERELRTEAENNYNHELEDRVETLASENSLLNQIFQCNKNIEILSQILKNKTGSLKKKKLTEIVETICDAGLRMASVMLDDQNEIDLYIDFIYKQYKKSEEYDNNKSDSYHINEIKQQLIFKVMLWVLNCVEKSVQAINKPELEVIITELAEEKQTPAYKIIRYLYLLDTCTTFDSRIKKQLELIVKEHNKSEHPFLNRMISIRTQYYESTHKVRESHRQAIFSILGIEYKKKSILKLALETESV